MLAFGPSDNLSAPQQFNKSDAEKQVISSILESDATINSFISKKYNEISGEKSHPETRVSNGGFMQWAYFHYGRLSFGTPAFYIPEIKVEPDSLDSSKKKKEGFNTIGIAVGEKRKFYDAFPLAKPDEFIIFATIGEVKYYFINFFRNPTRAIMRPDSRMPIPFTIFCMKNMPDENSPSVFLPVSNS